LLKRREGWHAEGLVLDPAKSVHFVGKHRLAKV
jgi:hypothetical protein